MPSNHETFWRHHRFAVVGHSAKKPFPVLTYGALKERGDTVYAVDPSARTIEGDAALEDLSALPGPVDGVILEVPREETAQWMQRAADLGVKDVWIHMTRETPEALEIARQHDINLRTGTCAVMYLKGGFHTLHKWVQKLRGRY